MKKLLPLFLLLVGCINTDTITALSDEGDRLLDDSIVASVLCTTPLSVPGQGECLGKNINGTVIRQAVLTFISSDPGVVEVNQAGDITAFAIGTSTICATGSRGATACTAVEVL